VKASVPSIPHFGFSDESRYNVGRFRGVGMISMPEIEMAEIESSLNRAMGESNVKEFKWQKLKTAQYRFAAERIIDICFEAACRGKLRIDVLIWDTEDHRHKTFGRDDLANLQRMYFHLYKNVLKKRWPYNSRWTLFPDQQSQIAWDDINYHLNHAGIGIAENDLFSSGGISLRLRTDFDVESIKQVNSCEVGLCQAADLFVGLGVFSWEAYDRYCQWKHQNSEQLTLFSNQEEVNFTNKENDRFWILRMFDQKCKSRKLSVGLKTTHGLLTKDPRKPINFWLYKSQSDQDIAPKRKLMQ